MEKKDCDHRNIRFKADLHGAVCPDCRDIVYGYVIVNYLLDQVERMKDREEELERLIKEPPEHQRPLKERWKRYREDT